MMAQRLSAPLTDPAQIAKRLDAVAAFTADTAARAETRSRLQAAPDLARALSRLAVGRGGPRDLAAIRDGVLAAADLARSSVHSRRRRPKLPKPCRCAAVPTACWRPNLPPRWRRNCPRSSATAASCARDINHHSTRRARCATKSGASSPHCRRVTSKKRASAFSRSSTTMCLAISSRSPRSTANG